VDAFLHLSSPGRKSIDRRSKTKLNDLTIPDNRRTTIWQQSILFVVASALPAQLGAGAAEIVGAEALPSTLSAI
jgi:hypothetical protein